MRRAIHPSVRESFGSDLIERQTSFYASDATGNLIETGTLQQLGRFQRHVLDRERMSTKIRGHE